MFLHKKKNSIPVLNNVSAKEIAYEARKLLSVWLVLTLNDILKYKMITKVQQIKNSIELTYMIEIYCRIHRQLPVFEEINFI